MFFVVLLVLALIAIGNGLPVSQRGPAAAPKEPSSDCLAAGLAWGAVVWSIVASAGLVLIPTSTSISVRTGSDGATAFTTTHRTLLANEGWSVLAVLIVPIAITTVGAVAGRRSKRNVRLRAGVLLTIGCLVAAASIGMFFIPSAIALVVAGVITRERTQDATNPPVVV